MQQIPLPIAPASEPSFGNFVVGPNAEALHLVQGLVLPGAPLYLWGPPGSGKTHLLRALVGRCQAQGQRVGWFDADHRLPWPLSPEWALVVIDGCERLTPEAQHAAFALFIDAATHGVQVAAAGRLPPVDLPVREDLRTRLGWGHIQGLSPLGEDETRAALRREADARGILLSDDVIDHVLLHFPRDLSSLMRLLDRLDGYALALGRRVTIPLLRQMLHDPEAPGNAAGLPAAESADAH